MIQRWQVLKNQINQLIQKALKGDEKAYNALLKRYQHGIYNMIYQMIKNKEETEDLVQETFIKAFHSLDSYNDQYAFSTWLYKIAFNNCIDSIRKRKLRTFSIDQTIVLKEGEVRHQIPAESPGPEGKLLFLERKKLIQKAVNSLPERYRRVIILRHQEDRSYDEISEILGIPLGTVKARIFRAREMLKKKLMKE
jgi:RNA polymerase sigma-70 factor (ECF subfamily)